jgi:hypothetical protein
MTSLSDSQARKVMSSHQIPVAELLERFGTART